MAKVIDISSNIYLFLNQPEDISLASIAHFLRNKIGELNSLIGKSYQLNNLLEIVDENNMEIGEDEMAIFVKIYTVHFFKRQLQQSLGAGSLELISSIESDGGVVRMVSKTEKAKVYLSLKRDEETALKNLVNLYNFRHGRASQITGDDFLSSRPTNPSIGFTLVRNFPDGTNNGL